MNARTIIGALFVLVLVDLIAENFIFTPSQPPPSECEGPHVGELVGFGSSTTDEWGNDCIGPNTPNLNLTMNQYLTGDPTYTVYCKFCATFPDGTYLGEEINVGLVPVTIMIPIIWMEMLFMDNTSHSMELQVMRTLIYPFVLFWS